MSEKLCPKCGVANPLLRSTCQACHAMLMPSAPGDPVPPVKQQRVISKPPLAPRKIKESVAKKNKPIARKAKVAIPGLRMFILEGSKLKTVIVTTSVKKSKPTPGEKTIISFWNRNKTLIK